MKSRCTSVSTAAGGDVKTGVKPLVYLARVHSGCAPLVLTVLCRDEGTPSTTPINWVLEYYALILFWFWVPIKDTYT